MRAWQVNVAAPQVLFVHGRVCALRKTEESIEIAQEGIRKQARKKGRKIRPETLELAKFVIVFTTLPEKDVPAEEVLERYRPGWHVELVFRVLKTGCGVQRTAFRSEVRLQRDVAFKRVIAWRLIVLTLLGRQVPELGADLLFTERSWSSCAPTPASTSSRSRTIWARPCTW